MINSFIKKPYLPQNAVKYVLLGDKYENLLAEPLRKQGVDTIVIPRSKLLDEYANAHTDMLICHIGDENVAICGEIQNYSSVLRTNYNLNVIICGKHNSPKYPDDVSLNFLVFNGYYIGRTDIISAEAESELHRHGFKPLHVKQGYAKCSVCVVDENSAITADSGIAAALRNTGIDVLEISSGYIDLDGCDYGFIGGACGKISHDKLAFTGTLEKHPDKDRIINFIRERGVEPIWLTERNCFDVGSIIPIIEY